MPHSKSTDPALPDVVFLLCLGAFFYLFRLGSGSLASWDEAIYATVAKEALRSGEWLRFTLGGDPWFDKPPLAIWATAFFYQCFGVHEFSARLFAALSGVGTILVTYLLGSKLLGRWAGFLGALVLTSSLHFIRFARFGIMDAPLTFFFTLALYFFWLGRTRNRYLIFSGITIGLAVMTKSFAALVVFPIVWLYTWWAGETDVLGRSSYWIGVMIGAAVALPWNLFQLLSHRADTFVRDALWVHLVQRTSRALDGHTGNFYYYIRVLINKYHPWILIAVVSGPLFLWKAFRERSKEIIFLTVWMFFYFAVITAVQTKLSWYLLPVYPPLSLSAGYLLSRAVKENHQKLVGALFVGVMFLHVYYGRIFVQDYSRDLKGIRSTVEKSVPPGAQLHLYNYHEAWAATFYLERKILYVDDKDAFSKAAAREGDFYCLIHQKDIGALRQALRHEFLVFHGSFEELWLFARK